MSRAGRIVAALRPATLVAGGAFAVHELTYLAGYGGAASHVAPDHSYLAGLVPALAVLVALTLLATVEGGLAEPRRRRVSPSACIVTYAAAILALFAVQEAAETLLAGGGAEHLGALLAHGVLVAVPLALGFGFLAWLAVRGLEAVEDRIAARFEGRTPSRRAGSGPRPRRLDVVLRPAMLAGGAAARAPPSV